MPLNQVCFHLAHGIKHDAHNDQQAGAAEKLGCDDGHIQPLTEETWKDCDQRQESRASKRESRHREIKKVGSWFSRPHARNVTAVFFKIVGDLSRLPRSFNRLKSPTILKNTAVTFRACGRENQLPTFLILR